MSRTLYDFNLVDAGVPFRDIEAFRRWAKPLHMIVTTREECLRRADKIDFRIYIARLLNQKSRALAAHAIAAAQDRHRVRNREIIRTHQACTKRLLASSAQDVTVAILTSKSIMLRDLRMLDVQMRRCYATLFCILYNREAA